MDKQAMLNAIKQQLSVKNVKDGIGHDLAGIFADVYLRKKKVGYYNNDGWGGETDIQLSSTARNDIEKMAIGLNMNQFLFDNGWEFMKSAEKINLSTQVEQMIYLLIDEVLVAKETKKFQAKLKKDMHRGICIGNHNGYRVISFKAGNLKSMVEIIGVKGVLLQIKLQIIPNIKEGDRILNTNLKELGLEIPDEVIRMAQK